MTIPIFEIKVSGRPIAIIKGGDKQLQFVKIAKFNGKYFATRDRMVYDLDDQYEYRYRNTSIYFYNFSNNKPISLSAMEEIDLKLRERGLSELPNKTRIYQEAMEQQLDVSQLQIDDLAENLSPESRRFLQDHQSDDEYSKTNMMVHIHHQKKPIVRYSGNLIGMGLNRGHFAFVQIAHKRLDIVPMFIKNNRAYTKYGVFDYSIDNIYLVKKQIVCFYVLSNDVEKPVRPYNKQEYKIMKGLIKKGKWDDLDKFNSYLDNLPPKEKRSISIKRKPKEKPIKKEKVPVITNVSKGPLLVYPATSDENEPKQILTAQIAHDKVMNMMSGVVPKVERQKKWKMFKHEPKPEKESVGKEPKKSFFSRKKHTDLPPMVDTSIPKSTLDTDNPDVEKSQINIPKQTKKSIWKFDLKSRKNGVKDEQSKE